MNDTATGNPPDPSKKKSDPAQRDLPAPTVSAFFGEEPVPVAMFFKSIREAKVARFSEDDARAAEGLLDANDGDARRLLVLAIQPSRPEAVERWLWPVVRTRLRAAVGPSLDPAERDPSAIFGSLRKALEAQLESEDPKVKRRAETLLSLGLAWLVTQRSLDPWAALSDLRLVFFPDIKQAAKAARRILVRGRVPDVKSAAAVASLAEERVREAVKQMDQEARRQALMQSQLRAAEAENVRLKQEIEVTTEQKRDLSARLAALETRLEQVQTHHGHDLTDTLAQQTVFLNERLSPLLSDALDALEIDPPAREVAVRRLRVALSSIQESVR